MGVKKDFSSRGHFVIGDGMKILFWEDISLGYASLSTQYSALYNIVRRKNVVVTDDMPRALLNIEFR